ncbi:site-specific integrase [Lactobacillus helveticus]|uniref:tyrosine-type recombinase/integrase n=1 Tax=Lactobacillus helveticus TaxID=1587 RepID=UPI0021823E5D|nr:site-specific integrase [Lactobacillus helveticus]MCT0196505.1 site-specific integrase [Lactobacillus helveticus]
MPKHKNTNIKPYKLKNGQKRYWFRIYLGMKGGKKVETSRRGFKSYDEADAVYKQLAAEDAQDYIKQKQITFDELYHKWLPFYSQNVKESTLWKTETLYKNHLKDQFGDQYIDQITTAEIADYFLDLSAKLVKYKMVFWYMRRILEHAIDINLLSRNPARASLLPKKTSVKKRRDVAHNFYTADQLHQFLDTAKEYNERTYIYFSILATTGMRKSEVLALKWSDIEFNKQRIYVQRTTAYGENGAYITQLPKGNKKRYVPLDDKLAHELKHYRRDLSDKLFHTAKKDYLRQSKPDQWLAAIYAKDPDLKKITIHGLRHTFATLLNQAGVNPKDVQAILGHSTLDLTLDVYTHSTPEGREKARAEINKLF